MSFFFDVALPLDIDRYFTYQCEEDLSLGTLVQVSFRNKTLFGVIWQKAQPFEKAKPILKTFPFIVFSKEIKLFLEKMSQYLVVNLGHILKMVIPSYLQIKTSQDSFLYLLSLDLSYKKRKKMLEKEELSLEDWRKKSGYSLKEIERFIEEKIFIRTKKEETEKQIFSKKEIFLNDEQEKIFSDFKKRSKDVFLIQGVTGSGKTELALKIAETFWMQKKQVLILVPEIILKDQWSERIKSYFDIEVGVWHSGSHKKNQVFQDILSKKYQVIVGARSALFLPYPNLGLIILDEEHEFSYKQTEGVLYQGRDMAVLRSSCEKIPLVLLSATPSLETLANVEKEKYQAGFLTKRHQEASLPEVEIVDMLQNMKTEKKLLSDTLIQAIHKNLDQKQQSLLFLNKRGYAPLLLCFRCSFRATCPSCSVYLSVHDYQKEKKLLCHYCGYQQPVFDLCPSCQKEPLTPMGLGIEKVEEEVVKIFPQAKTALISSDISFQKIQQLVEKIHSGEIDIIIGTQILAKGHHFPLLTCVGIIDADFALADIDIRSQERLFQIIQQVLGRAGRGKIPGKTYIQTFQKEHPFFHSLKSPETFLYTELEKRKNRNIVPYCKLAAIIVEGFKEKEVENFALDMAKKRPRSAFVEVLGPIPAPLYFLKNKYRWRFLLKSEKPWHIQKFLEHWKKNIKISSSVQCVLDIDPYYFL